MPVHLISNITKVQGLNARFYSSKVAANITELKGLSCKNKTVLDKQIKFAAF